MRASLDVLLILVIILYAIFSHLGCESGGTKRRSRTSGQQWRNAVRPSSPKFGKGNQGRMVYEMALHRQIHLSVKEKHRDFERVTRWRLGVWTVWVNLADNSTSLTTLLLLLLDGSLTGQNTIKLNLIPEEMFKISIVSALKPCVCVYCYTQVVVHLTDCFQFIYNFVKHINYIDYKHICRVN